jgi:hypothetical protein
MQHGTSEHRDLICGFFEETYEPFDPERIPWPVLEEADLARLRGLPVWDEAVSTERRTARIVTAYAGTVADAKMREAIALQGHEEQRHSRLLDVMTAHYGIPAKNGDDGATPEALEWEFLRIGYGECLDSFFAFGLFEVARRSRLFPRDLVMIFDRVLQEEARHITFFTSWLAHERARRSLLVRPFVSLRRLAALVTQAWSRARGVAGMESDHFTRSHESIELGMGAREFLELCLAENERRLGLYDPRLQRPRLVPWAVRRLLFLLPRDPRANVQPLELPVMPGPVSPERPRLSPQAG